MTSSGIDRLVDEIKLARPERAEGMFLADLVGGLAGGIEPVCLSATTALRRKG
jgi:hypothetical protein